MYESLINRKHRGLFVIAIDCSASMQERITFNSLSLSKAEAVALVCNYTIDELIARATRQGIVRDYYDIAVIGYSGDSIQPLIGDGTQQRIAIDLLAKMAPEPCSYTFDQNPDDGTTVGATFTLRPWITPRAAANTPMHKAMIEIERIVAEWCRMPENRDSFPPVVINISDGAQLSCIGISFSRSMLSTFNLSLLPRMTSVPRFFITLRWITPPMLALKKPSAAMVSPNALPPTKPWSSS